MALHGINTTVVEIDPAVTRYARDFFYLHSDVTVLHQDAIEFARKATAASILRYDYIIHDVFTGGAEPLELFSLEFLTQLRRLLTRKGFVAIVGLRPSSPPVPGLALVMLTLSQLEFWRRPEIRLDFGCPSHHPVRLPLLPRLPRL